MKSRDTFRLIVLSLTFVTANACSQGGAGTEGDAGAKSDAGGATPDVVSLPIAIRLLAINDFHGNLEPAQLANGATATTGGAAYLAAHVAKRRTPMTAFVSAGDLIGGSPLASGLFHDEPTIEVMNAMGLALNGVGNHEFDEGASELLRMQSGGCNPADGCKNSPTYAGANFRFLAANVVDRASGKSILPAYEIRDFGGAKIAFVGLTLKNTPNATLASAVKELDFRDEVETVTALVPEIRSKGAANIVLLFHEGGAQTGDFNACTDARGPLVDIAKRMPDEVKVIFGGHSHGSFNCRFAGKIVTLAGAYGQFLTVADLTIDPITQELTQASAENIAVSHDVPPDPTVAAIVARVSGAVAPLANSTAGTIAATISNTVEASGVCPLGHVIADAMLQASGGDAQFALMNPGGVRAPFVFEKSGSETIDGQVSFGEAFATQPFSNQLSTISVTGADIVKALDEGVGSGKIFQPSGLSYKWTSSTTPGERVLSGDVLIGGNGGGGTPISLGTTYRVTVNSIVLAAFPQATNTSGLGVDLDALVAYLKVKSPVSAPAGRITHQ